MCGGQLYMEGTYSLSTQCQTDSCQISSKISKKFFSPLQSVQFTVVRYLDEKKPVRNSVYGLQKNKNF
ncbi:Uncharacterised protein [Grimontia hollisae]|uniref:Uncharacterized protein n=1 Tax=Grimontia hollisae TaxID=673 RepID=A0A377HQA2_GRIHO|nr:Uncharacterised protein [Grimontia hollisae]STO57902.1 Uncharacterised protein [Grimontia hollisae]STQ76412.1 Uncharacterised protein [Grimontia hollisae]